MNKKIYSLAFAILLAVSLGTTLWISSANAATGEKKDPSGGYSFRVEIDGIVQASFLEVEGLNVSVDVTEYREGTDDLKPRLIPGIAHFGPLVLRKGIVDSETELWLWMKMTLDGEVDKRSMSIILSDPAKKDLMRFNLQEAWPSGWALSKLNALDKNPAVMELTIQYEDIAVVAAGVKSK